MKRLDFIRKRIDDGKFSISENVPLSDGSVADFVASRTYFSWKGLVILSQHVVVTSIAHPRVADVDALFEPAFKIGKDRNRVPLLRGLQFGFMIVPVIIAEEVSDEVKRHVEQPPKKRWSLFEFPVVCRNSSTDTFYFRSTPMWGGFFFSDLRELVAKYINQIEQDCALQSATAPESNPKSDRDPNPESEGRSH